MNYNEEELLQIVARQVKKYTSNDSSSITYQTARKIMSSVLYCMKEEEFSHTILFDKKEEDSQIRNIGSNISALQAFDFGLKKKKEKIQKAKELLKRISLTFEDYQNDCYQDTILTGMKAFFEWYDVNFDATNHILTLDYPLLCEIRELKGIDLIYEYLLRTLVEQKFLACFDTEEIISILYSYHKNHKELIINVSKIVLRNVLGHMIVESSPFHLSVSEEERNIIKNVCEKKSIEEIEKILREALYQFIEMKWSHVPAMFSYFENDIPDIAYEIKNGIKNHCLEKTFVEIIREEQITESIYMEGTQMEDEVLRELIDKMHDLTVETRIELIKEKIRCLADLKEFLKVSFYEQEYDLVFGLLSSQEISILLKEIKDKIAFDEELDEWEKRFLTWN
jgi:Family of unknown function (DUF6179)